MPDLDDYTPEFPCCDVCRQACCACAQSVAEIDAWADAYLGSEACAQDYAQACTTAQWFLAHMDPGAVERPRPPACFGRLGTADTGR